MVPRKKMKKTKLIFVIVLVSVVLLASLGFLGYFGVKSMRRSHLRMQAREAFAAEDWKKAEKLLNEYVGKDPDSEEDFVRLAQVYRHFGNTGAEMHCWYKASVLNPLKPEYWDNYTDCAMNARDFGHLYSALSRKLVFNAELSRKDKLRYLICAVMTNRAGDARKYYERIFRTTPEIFRKDDLGRLAEYVVTFDKLSDAERSSFIRDGMQSDDPFVRLECILFRATTLAVSGEEDLKQKESLLKQAAELNRYAATPFLVDFYYSNRIFGAVILVAEPYLADIENALMSVLYAESCVYSGHSEKLPPLIGHFRSLGRKYRTQTAYFEALYDFTQDNGNLARHMQEAGGVARSDLTNLMNLQIALNNDNKEKIVSIFETIMNDPPSRDLRERARSAVRIYLETKLQEKPDLASDPGIIKLSRLVSGRDNKDPLLMRITISDLRNRNVLTRQILEENLKAFPQDRYLLQVAAEFELFNGNPELCLDYVERFYALEKEERSTAFDFLHMLALELTGKIDEATKEYAALLDHTGMDREILYRYLRFCIEHKRGEELSKMADRLDASNAPDLKALAPFFQAEALLLQEKKDEALALLETAKTDLPEFAFRAANLFLKYNLLDQALSRYQALADGNYSRQMVFANIAEVYLSKGMKKEALSYAKQAWEMNREVGIGQFVYAKMLAANEQYQEAGKVLNIPNRKVEMPEEVMTLWTDIMHHAIEKSIADQRYMQAEDQCKHLLIFVPDDELAKESLEKVRKRLGQRNSGKRVESPLPAGPAK
jgi:tetratricopeptide (TPR) repeat protein